MTEQYPDNSTHSSGETPLHADRMAKLAQMERYHFWFAGRLRLVDRLMDKYVSHSGTVLDLGCGTGWNTIHFKERGFHTIGLDLRIDGLQATHHASPDHSYLQAGALNLPFPDQSMEAVIALDLVEHANDQLVLEEVRRTLIPGGKAIFTTPAIPWLWSFRDEDAGHLRRYTIKGLRRVAEKSRLRIIETRFYMFAFFPLLLITRLLGRRSPGMRDMEDQPGTLLNSIMKWITFLEVSLGDFIPWPWGSTLVAVCERPVEHS